MSDQLQMDPPPRRNDIAIWDANGQWHRISPADYMAKLSVLEANLPYVEREIPVILNATTLLSALPYFPDEVAANNAAVLFTTPKTWDGVSDIVLKTTWFCTSTGLKDIETATAYVTETDEAALTVLASFTNTNLTWTAANVTKILTTTIAASNIAAGRSFRVLFRCNTGDANTGDLLIEGAYARTKYR